MAEKRDTPPTNLREAALRQLRARLAKELLRELDTIKKAVHSRIILRLQEDQARMEANHRKEEKKSLLKNTLSCLMKIIRPSR